MTTIDTTALARLFPRPRDGARGKVWDGYMAAMGSGQCADLLARFEITTHLRLCHLLATWAHETGGFTVLWESGLYLAERIVAIFGQGRHSAAVTPAEARRLAGNPYALFERVYGLGNPRKAAELGNTEPGDGFNCRGLGIQQLTGKRDHNKYAALVGCTRADLAKPINAIHAALLEWQAKGCNALADRDDVVGVCRKINGGTNGLDDRRAKLALLKKRLPATPTPSATGAPAATFPVEVPTGAVPALQNDASRTAAPASVGEAVRDRRQEELELGDADEAVREAQVLLSRAGYPVGDHDGRFGVLTERAVVAFQHARGLPVTGKVDAATLAALEATSPEPSLPGRETLDAKDLAARGSETIGVWSRVQAVGKWIKGLVGGTVVGEAAGLEPVNGAVTLLEQGKGLAERSAGLAGISLQPKWIALAVVLIAAIWLSRWAASGIARRVEDAKSGHLGR